jgi:5-methyltetrahydrofolate--homocysteine methyltransferase
MGEVWRHLNPRMLYGRHLGLKGDVNGLRARGDEKAKALTDLIDELKAESPPRARAVWRFFPARREGDAIVVGDRRLAFPRQERGDRLCLADFVSHGAGDHVCLFAVTAGEGIREKAERFKQSGEFLKSHALSALALETAEAAAEWLHSKLRGLWGFPDPAGTPMLDRFRGNYRGKRYSFGYPACPDLSMQGDLFDLLQPEDIGLQLTEEFMMDPEASVSALVLHHPDARYFTA